MSKKRKKTAASVRPFPRLKTDDDWKPRGNKAKGDRRPYVRTNKGAMPGLPQEDEYNPGVVWCGTSKRLWVGDKPKRRFRREETPGKKTLVRKLFELLYQTPGCWHSIWEIHEKVFGSSLNGVSKAEMKRGVENVRRLISKVKRRMAEWKADEDAIIVAKSYNRRPGYMMLLLPDQKYEKGQEPWPELGYIDREDRLILKEEWRRNGQQPGVVYWGDKSIHLGEITYLRKLFHFLADQPGRWRPVSEIEEFVFGTRCDTSVGVSKAEMGKTQQKLRRLISRLNERMRESGLNDEAVIVPHDYYYRPGYIFLLIPKQKFEKGQELQPKH